jgi:hypothetical protein
MLIDRHLEASIFLLDPLPSFRSSPDADLQSNQKLDALKSAVSKASTA